MRSRIWRWRSAWGALACATALAVGWTVAAQGQSAHAARRHGPRPAVMVLPLPSAGDLTYGVAQVRIDRRSGPLGRGGRTAIFRSRFGGLSVAARSGAWPKLRRTTHVYVVAGRVAGANPSVRDVVFFVVRHTGGPRVRGGAVTFTISNAHAQRSYWVHGVDRHGVARIFVARNDISTSIGNWSRYLGVLHLAKALFAARHPVVIHAPATAKRRKPTHPAALWRGGNRMDALTYQVFKLTFGTLGSTNAYAAAKRSPLVTQFIVRELGNRPLARKWQRIVDALPLIVPDRYAAAAQEEARFSPVSSPRISAKRVVIADSSNSTTEGAKQEPPAAAPPPPTQTVRVLPRNPPVEVFSNNGVNGAILCGGPLHERQCSEAFSSGQTVTLSTEQNASNPLIPTWRGCNSVFLPGSVNADCVLRINVTKPGTVHTVRVSFKPLPPATGTTHLLQVSSARAGSGTISSSPAGVNCASCSANFASGQFVTLTATPASGSTFTGWSGCDGASGNTCGVNMNTDRSVTATFGLAPVSHAGTLDPAFGSGGLKRASTGDGVPVGGATGIVHQNDGKLVTVGTGTSSGATVTYVSRYLSDGTPDPNFGTNGTVTITNPSGETFVGRSLALDGNGNIVVAGGLLFGATPGKEDFALVRLLGTNGTVDPNFNSGSIVDTPMGTTTPEGGEIESVVVDTTSGEIYAGGWADVPAPQGQDFALAAYDSSGTLESGFTGGGKVLTPVGAGGIDQINGLALDGGNVVAAGFASGPSHLEPAVVEYTGGTSGGGLVSGFNGGSPLLFPMGTADAGAYSVAVQADGKIVLGGFLQADASGTNCMGLARLKTDGTLDSGSGGFGSGGIAQVCHGTGASADGAATGLAVDANGIYAGGYVYDSGESEIALARLTSSGSLDPSFGGTGLVLSQPAASGMSSSANALVLDGTNPVVAGYAYTSGTAPANLDTVIERWLGQ